MRAAPGPAAQAAGELQARRAAAQSERGARRAPEAAGRAEARRALPDQRVKGGVAGDMPAAADGAIGGLVDELGIDVGDAVGMGAAPAHRATDDNQPVEGNL